MSTISPHSGSTHAIAHHAPAPPRARVDNDGDHDNNKPDATSAKPPAAGGTKRAVDIKA